MRKLAGILLLCVLMLLGGAAAETEKVPAAGSASVPGQTVLAREQRLGWILSLPGCWDASKVILRCGSEEWIYLGQQKMKVFAEEPADLSALIGQRVPLFDHRERSLGTLTIYQGSRLPALFLQADPEQLARVRKSKDYTVHEGRAVIQEADGTVCHEGTLDQLKCRGNNTFRYSKKPYQIKLSQKAAPGGMTEAKTWVLLANWSDISLLRNQIVLDLSRDLGVPYAVDCRQADVWINGEYQGLYLLTEKIQIKKDRINFRDLEDLTEELNDQPPESFRMYRSSRKEAPLQRGYLIPENPEDITGGYIVSLEKYHRMRDNLLPGFRTEQGLSVQIKEPTFPSREQVDYLTEVFNSLHRAVTAADGTDPVTGKALAEIVDLPSVQRRFLVEEWTKNYDFLGGSQIYLKDADSRDPLVYAGPSWDYDLSFGNMRDRGFSPEGGYVTALSRRPANLLWLFSRHEDFMAGVREIWKTKMRGEAAVLLGEAAAEEGMCLRSLQAYREEIRASAEMNYVRWTVGNSSAAEAGGNFENAAAYLEKWIRLRTAWMDRAYGT